MPQQGEWVFHLRYFFRRVTKEMRDVRTGIDVTTSREIEYADYDWRQFRDLISETFLFA